MRRRTLQALSDKSIIFSTTKNIEVKRLGEMKGKRESMTPRYAWGKFQECWTKTAEATGKKKTTARVYKKKEKERNIYFPRIKKNDDDSQNKQLVYNIVFFSIPFRYLFKRSAPLKKKKAILSSNRWQFKIFVYDIILMYLFSTLLFNVYFKSHRLYWCYYTNILLNLFFDPKKKKPKADGMKPNMSEGTRVIAVMAR